MSNPNFALVNPPTHRVYVWFNTPKDTVEHIDFDTSDFDGSVSSILKHLTEYVQTGLVYVSVEEYVYREFGGRSTRGVYEAKIR